MRKLIVTFCATFFTTLALVPTIASANCSQIVYATELFTNGTTTYLYGEPFGAGNTYTYFGTTTNAVIADAAASAAANNKRVNITGNATTCPTTGTYRFVGTILYLYISP